MFLIFSFISIYSLYYSFTLFTKTHLSRIIHESIKELEIKTSMLFDIAFANNIILSCFFFFFLIIDLYFFNPATIAQIFITTAELVMPTRISTKEAKTEIETHAITVET